MGDSGNFTAALSAATCGTKLELLVVQLPVVQTERTGWPAAAVDETQ